MPDAPDIVLCSKSCRHTPTDSSPVIVGHSLGLRIDKFSFLVDFLAVTNVAP